MVGDDDGAAGRLIGGAAQGWRGVVGRADVYGGDECRGVVQRHAINGLGGGVAGGVVDIGGEGQRAVAQVADIGGCCGPAVVWLDRGGDRHGDGAVIEAHGDRLARFSRGGAADGDGVVLGGVVDGVAIAAIVVDGDGGGDGVFIGRLIGGGEIAGGVGLAGVDRDGREAIGDGANVEHGAPCAAATADGLGGWRCTGDADGQIAIGHRAGAADGVAGGIGLIGDWRVGHGDRWEGGVDGQFIVGGVAAAVAGVVGAGDSHFIHAIDVRAEGTTGRGVAAGIDAPGAAGGGGGVGGAGDCHRDGRAGFGGAGNHRRWVVGGLAGDDGHSRGGGVDGQLIASDIARAVADGISAGDDHLVDAVDIGRETATCGAVAACVDAPVASAIDGWCIGCAGNGHG